MADDEIRRKRLARLSATPEAGSSASTSSNESIVSPPPASSSVKKTPIKSLEAMEVSSPRKTVEPMDTDLPRKHDVMEVTVSNANSQFARWQNEALHRIFKVTVDADSKEQYTFLAGLAHELNEEGVTHPVQFTKEMTDRIVMARLATPSASTANDEVILFKYLLACYKRLVQEDKMIRSLKINDLAERVAVLEHARDIIISYSGLVLTEAEMFDQPPNITSQGSLLLLSHLQAPPGNDDFVPVEFWELFIARFEHDGLDNIFLPLIKATCAEMRSTNILGNFTAPLATFAFLMRLKPIAEMAVKSPNWLPSNVTGLEFEMTSMLGPFLRPSVFFDGDPAVGRQYFPDTSNLRQADLSNATSILRSSLAMLNKIQFDLLKGLLTVSPIVKESTLNYFAAVVAKNEGRARMHVDEQLVSTDGFLVNQTLVLLRLCEPFLAPNSQKAALIDPFYILRNQRIDISKETRLAMSEKDATEWAKQHVTSDSPANFISECFWLTAFYLHIGVSRCFVKYRESMQEYREIKRHVEDIESSRPFPPHLAAQYEQYLVRTRAKMDECIRRQICLDIQLQDPELLTSLFRFYNLMASVLLRIARGNQTNVSPTYDPLDRIDVPPSFTALPEWLVSDITEFGLFVFQTIPIQLRLAIFDEIFALGVLVIDQPLYIKNPYTRAEFVNLIHFVTPDRHEQLGGADLSILLDTHPVLLKHLVNAVMNFYSEVESTGSSHQFYEKFSIRHQIALIMKYIWKNKTHHANVITASQNLTSFIRFVNLLRNDTTYLLDEGMTKLTEIYNIQVRMKNVEQWNATPLTERKEVEKTLAQTERHVVSLMLLVNETVNMLRYLTEDIKEPFLRPEIINDLVAMLNFNIDRLVGPKTTELKVENKEKYYFKPRELLANLIDVYLHLNSPPFIEAMAQEGRSYKAQLFVKACDIMRRFGLRDETAIDHVLVLVDDVEKRRASAKTQEELMGDIPDEFLDPITAELMRDPVILPSGNRVDRQTIVKHLLSDKTDPFNRQALTIDMIKPDDELRQQILDFINKSSTPQ